MIGHVQCAYALLPRCTYGFDPFDPTDPEWTKKVKTRVSNNTNKGGVYMNSTYDTYQERRWLDAGTHSHAAGRLGKG